MTPEQFNALSVEVQKKIFDEADSPITSQIKDELTTILKQIDNFYVELVYWNRKDRLIGFEAFSNVERLEPYLNGRPLYLLFRLAPVPKHWLN